MSTTTTMTEAIRAILTTLEAHAWPSPISQIGLRGPTDLLQMDLDLVAVQTPALYLNIADRRRVDLDEHEQYARVRHARLPRRCQFQIYCLLGAQTADLTTELFEMSEAVCALLERRETKPAARFGQRWGLGDAVFWPESVEDVEADLGLAGIGARLVQWEQVLMLPELAPA